MAKNLWDEFDKAIDTAGLQQDVQDASERNFKDVPFGLYEVSVEKMELVASKETKNPMVSIWFKITEGELSGSMIFYNQVITKGFQIHLVNELLRSMNTDLPIEFKTYKQYGNLLMDVHEAINNQYEFALKYGEGKKGFATYEITKVFELE